MYKRKKVHGEKHGIWHGDTKIKCGKRYKSQVQKPSVMVIGDSIFELKPKIVLISMKHQTSEMSQIWVISNTSFDDPSRYWDRV